MRHPQRLLFTLAALITVSSCKSEAPKPPPPKVQAVSTQLAEFTEGVDTVSTLEASNLVELAAQSGGRILELKIRQGDEVAPGQLLVVLDQVAGLQGADGVNNLSEFSQLGGNGLHLRRRRLRRFALAGTDRDQCREGEQESLRMTHGKRDFAGLWGVRESLSAKVSTCRNRHPKKCSIRPSSSAD